jgi:hypothetical protein
LTVFEPPAGPFNIGGGSFNSQPLAPGAADLVSFAGIQIGGNSGQVFSNISMFGCYCATSINMTNAFFDSVASGAVFSGVDVRGGVLLTGVGVSWEGASAGFDNVVGATFSEAFLTAIGCDVVILGGLDFDGPSTCLIASRGGSWRTTSGTRIELSGTITQFARIEQHSSLQLAGGNVVAGVTTGDCIQFSLSSFGTGVENACNGTLTSSGGDQVVVGDNAGATFASLPANDQAATAPEFCFAN